MEDKHQSDSASSHDAKSQEFWQNPPIHPAALLLPMMGDAEIDETADNIFENGLVDPLDIFVDNHAEANGSKGPFPHQLMDGRCRWEAIKRQGHKSPLEVNTRGLRYHNAIKWDRKRKRWVTDCDPYAYVLSKNVHRRHLTAEQKREAIAAYIKADPQASNRKVAKALKADDHMVAGVREETALNAGIPQMAHVPMERAKAAIVENPDASGREIAKIAGVGEATIRRARKELAAAPEPETKPKVDAAHRRHLTDEVAGDVRTALEPVWKKWCAVDDPDFDRNLFVTAVRRFLKTGAKVSES